MRKIWVMKWIERERGFGHRPDGYSLHASPEACALYVKAYWDKMPKSTPDEYEAPEWSQPQAVNASDAVAGWVSREGRRLAHRAGEIKDGVFELADHYQELSAQIEREHLDQTTQRAAASPKKQSL